MASAPSTRERLIDAAFAVVAREGLEAASVKLIAAEAGLTPGLLHYHFATKDALLEAALRRALEDYIQEVRRRRLATPPDKLIAKMFADARVSLRQDADVFRVRLSFAVRALAHPDLAAVMRDLNAVAIEEMALTLAAAAGRATVTQRDAQLAATLKATFDGIMLACLTDPGFPIAAADAFLAEATRGWLAAP